MTSAQTPNLTKYHFLGFCLVLLSLLSLVFYQLFVNTHFQRFSFKEFFSLKTLTQALHHLPYQPLDLGEPQNFSQSNLIKVNCSEFCVFNIQNNTDTTTIISYKRIPALVDNDGKGRLKNLKLHFFDSLDSQIGLIGYENLIPENPTFYVIDLKSQLIQTIRLNLNHQKILSFVNYYPKTKQILFKSKDLNNQSEEFMLYSATSPSLTLLGTNQP